MLGPGYLLVAEEDDLSFEEDVPDLGDRLIRQIVAEVDSVDLRTDAGGKPPFDQLRSHLGGHGLIQAHR